MARNLEVKVNLNAEEFVAFRALCESFGLSQSAKARELIKIAIRDYALSSIDPAPESTDESGRKE